MSSASKRTPVSKSSPCRICGGDHKCSTGDDGLYFCGRESGEVAGFRNLKPSKNDPQFCLYRELDEKPTKPVRVKVLRMDWGEQNRGYLSSFDDKAKVALARVLGLPIEVFSTLAIGACPVDSEGPCWTFPECNASGKVIGVSKRFLQPNKDGSARKKMFPATNRGLTLPTGWREKSGALNIVEGPTDTLAMIAADLCCIGRPSNKAGGELLDELLRDWPADRAIVVWGENDARPDPKDKTKTLWPGKEGMELVAGNLAARLARPILTAMPPNGAKDCRDWLVVKAKDVGWVEAGKALVAATQPESAKPIEPPPPVSRFTLTDYGNCQRLVDRHGKDARNTPSHGGWLMWVGGRWESDGTGEIVRRAKETVRYIYVEASKETTTLGREQMAKHAFHSESARRIHAMIDLAKSEPGVAIRSEELDAKPWLLNCPNGTLNLQSGKLYAHRREDLLTKLCPTIYEPAARCPIWENALMAIFPRDPENRTAGGNEHLIGYIRRLFGLCLTGCIENILPIFWGGGANGKSSILNTVRAVIGDDYAMQAPANFLMEKQFDNHPTELADLHGKRLVIATETKQNRRIDESLIKQLTGGERVRARRMRQDFFEFDPTHKLILCTNHRPRVSESDDGIWRRLALIPFLVKFWNPDRNEFGPDYLRQDKNLMGRLVAEFPGILAWMVRGCLEWQASGLGTPPEVEQQTAGYRAEEDVIGTFLTERVIIGNSGCESLKDVYAFYRQWCEQTRERFSSSRQFAADLRRRGHKVENGTGNKVNCLGFLLKRSMATTLDEIAEGE